MGSPYFFQIGSRKRSSTHTLEIDLTIIITLDQKRK
jgi:hypothetical protein